MWVCRLPVHIGPAEHTIFTGIFGEFVTSQRADVGIGPYNGLCIFSAAHRAEQSPAPTDCGQRFSDFA